MNLGLIEFQYFENFPGKDVAVMKGRMHDISVVADHGGALKVGTIGHTIKGINEMISMLENKSVHGFLMDRNTYYHFSDRIKEPKYQFIAERIKKV